VKPIFVYLWWSSQISFLSKGLWIFLLWEVLLCGQTVETLSCGIELIDFLFRLMEAMFSNLTQKRPPKLCSDHSPILFDCRVLHRGRRYFKFKNMWLKSKDFVDRLK